MFYRAFALLLENSRTILVRASFNASTSVMDARCPNVYLRLLSSD
jgi:hypothetical protein